MNFQSFYFDSRNLVKKLPIVKINTFLFAISYHTDIKLALTLQIFILLMRPINEHLAFHFFMQA